MNSIRSRLLLWQISAVLLTALLVSALTYRLAWNGFNQVRDYGLEQIAHSVLRHDETPVPTHPPRTAPPAPSTASASPGQTSTTADGQTLAESGEEDEEDLGQFLSQVWSNEGELIYSSLQEDGPPLQQPGFHVQTWQDQTWRIFTLPRGARTVQVAVTAQDRAKGFSELIPWILVPLALLVVVLGLFIHEAVARALLPLERLRRDIGERDVSELHAVPTQDLPEEVVPLAHTLNQLLQQLDTLLAHQRQFLADAAHELNTPLAAIKLQAQLARRAQDADKDAALNELDQGIERAIHLVAQLLQMARLEPDARKPEQTLVPLDGLVRQVVGAFSARAEERGIDLGVENAEATWVLGDPHALRALLDNLVDNALRYTPPGARVDLRLQAVGDAQVALEVSDSGPGIAQADRQRVLDRFVRLAHLSADANATGSGLGLSIVREIALRHHAELALLDTPGGGLTVRLLFARAPALVTVAT